MTSDSDNNKKQQAIQLLEAIDEGDQAAIEKLLAEGCPTSYPGVTDSALMYALPYARTPVITAIADAGAPLIFGTPEERPHERTTRRNINKVFERGTISPDDLDPAFHYVTWRGLEGVAMQLLERGADPMYRDEQGLSYALELAVDQGLRRLIPAITQRLSQSDKDTLLATYVQAEKIDCVRILLGAGADPAQRIGGRSLLQLAPRGADDLKRLLRSAKTGQSIELAMGAEDATQPAPSAKLSLTL